MSDGGFNRKEFQGGWDSDNSQPYLGVWIYAYTAGTGFTNHAVNGKTFYDSEDPATASSQTKVQGNVAKDWVDGYFNNDIYDIEIRATDATEILKQLTSVRGIGDYHITDYQTSYPSAAAANLGHLVPKFDGSNNFEELGINEGSGPAFLKLISKTSGNLSFRSAQEFGTFDTGASASTNTTTLDAAISGCMSTGHDLMIPVGAYSLNPVTYTNATNDFISAIRMFGAGSMMIGEIDEAVSKSVLDFTGLTTSQIGIEFEKTVGGGFANLTLESLTLAGPGSGGSSIGINFKGVAGSVPHGLHQRLIGVGLKGFYQGFHITGTNNWGLTIRDSSAQSCTIGWNLNNKSTIGMWSNVHALSCTHGFRIGQGAQNQTFINPHVETATNGFVFDTENAADIQDMTFINPYFESITGSDMLFGFEIDGTANTSNAIRRPVVIGGTWASTAANIRVTPGKMNDPYMVNVMEGNSTWNVAQIISSNTASPVQLTTRLPHGLTTGDKVYPTNTGKATLDSLVHTATVIDTTKFTVPIDGSGFGTDITDGQVIQNDNWEGPMNYGFVKPVGGSSDILYLSDADGDIAALRGFRGGGLQIQGLKNTAGINLSTEITLEDSATPSVRGGTLFVTGGTTTVTDFIGTNTGQIIYLLSAHAITITDGTNIFLSGSADFVMADTDTLILVQKSDGNWYELARSVN